MNEMNEGEEGSKRSQESVRSERVILRLVGAQYLVLGMGIAVLLWKAVQMVLLGKTVTLKSGIEVLLVAVVVPAVVWLANREEVRLRKDLQKRNEELEKNFRELQERNRQLELRNQETRALNRLIQGHLAGCLAEESGESVPAAHINLVPAVSGNGHKTNGHHGDVVAVAGGQHRGGLSGEN